MDKPFKILSIDGGGIRGVFPAHILKCIEERLEINLLDTFDMIAGTSTGSIIAAGVAVNIPANKIVELYQEHGKEIFQKKNTFLNCIRVESLQFLFDSTYDSQYLENMLKKVFENKKLGDIRKPLIIPATDIGNGCVHVLKSHYSKDFTRDKDVLIKDAILASCSAPTYFNPHKLNEYLLADGGLWANNPGLAAVIDAQKRLEVTQENIKILSIGAGHSKTSYGINPFRKWGLLRGWERKKFIDFIFSLQSQSALNYLNLMLRPEQIMRIDFESDLSLPMDDVSIMNDLISKADNMFTHESKLVEEFIKGGN